MVNCNGLNRDGFRQKQMKLLRICMNKVTAAIFTIAGAVLFAAGLSLPFVHVVPGERLGPIDGPIVWILSDENTYSMLQSIVAIWDDSYFLGAIAFAFTILLPTTKLSLLTYSLFSHGPSFVHATTVKKWAERLGPWSMLEVFLVALTLLVAKSIPFGTAIHPLSGFYCFWASIISTLIAAALLPETQNAANIGAMNCTNNPLQRSGESDEIKVENLSSPPAER